MFLSLLGLGDSGYLLWEYQAGESAFCPASGCDLVSRGEYAKVRGIPVAALGMGAYLTLLALSIMAIMLGGRNLVGMIFAVSGIGVGVSAFLVYLQVAVIKAMCFWCGLSALTMTSIFAVGLALLHGMRRLNLSERAAKEGEGR